ncbi:MAG: hypothetical protein GX020_07125 [Firmicutes bacterium]|nr:hypothetical protein [Bacillota bacterium]
MRNEKGSTLIEVLLTIGIASLIVGSAITILLFGISSYNRANEGSRVHQELKLAGFAISNEIRRVRPDGVELVDSNEVNVQDGFSYFYLASKNGKFELMQVSEGKSLAVTSEVITDIAFSVEKKGSQYYFVFEINSDKYSVASEVLMPNITNYPSEHLGIKRDAVRYLVR